MPKTFRGFNFDSRTIAMIRLAEKDAKLPLVITQGSYNKGGVSASAGTHDGGGVVDLSVRELSKPQIDVILRAMKDIGFAAWYRPDRPGTWSAHIHAVAIGCPDLAPIAKRQVTAFDAGRDGLASNKVDKTYRPKPAVVFDFSLGKAVPRKKGTLSKLANALNRKKVQ